MSEKSYLLESAVDSRLELEGLDDLHSAFVAYFGGNLSFAPLEEENVKNILELGSGSGAWAIDAALRFPQADVLAVDISSIPPRFVPDNLHFMQHDLSQPLPLEINKFDVIHARLLMMHVPNPGHVLQHIIDLLKPGGWLILEDPDDEQKAEDGQLLGFVGTSPLVAALHKSIRSRGADPSFGREHEKLLISSGSFQEVHSKKVVIPMSGQDLGVAENTLARVWRERYKHVARGLPVRLSGEGITPDVLNQYLTAMDDPSSNFTSVVYFSWARKKLL